MEETRRKSEYAFRATTVEEFEIWKQALRKRPREISGIERCMAADAEANYVRTNEVDEFAAEYHILETEPGIITSGYFYGVKESLIELPQNCACNYVPHFFETADMGELGALIAPRPFFIESGEKDSLCGKSGIGNVLPQVEVARGAYRLFGKENNIVHSIYKYFPKNVEIK